MAVQSVPAFRALIESAETEAARVSGGTAAPAVLRLIQQLGANAFLLGIEHARREMRESPDIGRE